MTDPTSHEPARPSDHQPDPTLDYDRCYDCGQPITSSMVGGDRTNPHYRCFS